MVRPVQFKDDVVAGVPPWNLDPPGIISVRAVAPKQSKEPIGGPCSKKVGLVLAMTLLRFVPCERNQHFRFTIPEQPTLRIANVPRAMGDVLQQRGRTGDPGCGREEGLGGARPLCRRQFDRER